MRGPCSMTAWRAARLSRLLAQQQGPGRAFAPLWDGDNKVLARSRDADRYLGEQLPETMVPESGVIKVTSLEGEEAVMAVERVAGTPWTLGVAVPLAVV